MNYVLTILSSAAIYVLIIIGIRLLGKKELSQLSITDLVFVMLLGNAVQNAMIGPDDDFLSGILAALTLILLNRLFNRLLYRSARLSRLMEGEPVILIRNGKVNDRQLRRYMLTRDDLAQMCRESGYAHIRDVKLAILEVDGKISFPDLSGDKG